MRAPRLTVSSAALLFTGGCVHLDQFSNTATDFNVQVADAQNRTLLLNIARAANRYPMHFTELTTLSGTGTLTVGGTLTIPAGILHGGTGTGSVAPTATVTRTPTFNVAVLETQEFYKGMLNPVSLDQWATYIVEGLQPELVYTLAFGEIFYQQTPASKPVRIENNFHPLSPEHETVCPQSKEDRTQDGNSTTKRSEYLCFKAVVRALVDRHLTTEQVKSVANLGPPLAQGAFNDLKWLSGLDPKIFKIAAVDVDACKKKAESCTEGLEGLTQDQRDLLNKGVQLYRVQKESTDFRFCFNEPLQPPTRDQPDYAELTQRIAHASIPPKLICHNRLPPDYKLPKEESTPEGLKIGLADDSKAGEQFTVQFQPRSTEGLVYFLGEIARCTSRLDTLSVCSKPTVFVPYRELGNREDVLFSVSKGPSPRLSQGESDQGTIGVNWGGARYGVTMDPTGRDRSGQVLRITSQLLALNRSAKDFPAPAILPVISR